MLLVPENWFESKEDPWMDFGDATEFLHSTHPRFIFLKTLSRHATVLDIGAGEGSLHIFREWIKPLRRDIRIYAYAMEKGRDFDLCDGYELGRWPEKKPHFEGVGFDAIFTSHFIEHIVDPQSFISWATSRLNPGGRIYCEWPSEHALHQHRVDKFKARGVPLQISNFHDDRTHQLAVPDRSMVLNMLEGSGLLIDQLGFVCNRFMEQEALAHFNHGNLDSFSLQSAFWSSSRWAQYVIATKMN